MEIENHTPFPALWYAGPNAKGEDTVILITKATFAFDWDGRLSVAPEQWPIQKSDTYHGEPGRSSMAWESDLAPCKPGADLVLLGHAHAPGGSAVQVDVRFQVGEVQKVVRVFGNRRWESGLLGPRISKPEPFERMPLIYEKAFGGRDETSADPAQHEGYLPNPVGTGFRKNLQQVDGVALPSLEDPRQLIARPSDRPRPAGFGFWGRSWSPRGELAGTYDSEWRTTRAPLLPTNFSDRYFHAAHPDLIRSKPLMGGEPICVENAAPVSPLGLRVPQLELLSRVAIEQRWQLLPSALDTLVLDMDAQRLVLIYRASLVCHRQLLRLRGFRLDLQKEAA